MSKFPNFAQLFVRIYPPALIRHRFFYIIFKQDMSQTIFEKLQLKNEKTILIQGLPSSIEKQFSKLAFAKNLTPLLCARKLDFVLIFAVSKNQLNGILNDILPAFKDATNFWVAHPKLASKIVTDLNRQSSWLKLTDAGYEGQEVVTLDHVWIATNFKKAEVLAEIELSTFDTTDVKTTVSKRKAVRV